MPKSDQGIEEKRYHFVPRTLIFLFDGKNRVLLLRGAEDKRLWAGLHNGIGGHVERGEDIYDAAYRELQEETGIVDAKLSYCGQISVDVSDDVGVAIYVFKGIYKSSEFTNSHEGTLSWVSLDDVGSTPLVEDLTKLIPLVAAHQPSDPIIIGKYKYGRDGCIETSFR